MPKLHYVQKANKSQDKYGIKKGQPYWWWYAPRKPRSKARGTILRSPKKPKPSALVGSPFLKACMQIQEELEEASQQLNSTDAVKDFVETLQGYAEGFRDMGSDETGKLQNIPESLQASATATLLETRAEQCEVVAEALSSAATEIEQLDTGEEMTSDEEARICVSAAQVFTNILWEFD